MSDSELVALVTCDLGAIVRGRSLLASELGRALRAGVGWTPANQALTPFGGLAEPNPFGAIGDVRLLPDRDTQVRVAGDARANADNTTPLAFLLCDIVETDGQPWDCCPRHFLREALGELQELDIRVSASFEHEFQLRSAELPALPFSLEQQRRAEPFATALMEALVEAGVQPERIFPEFAAHQFEIPLTPAEGLAAADRSVVFKEVVREVARRYDTRATFTPLLVPAEAGNGVHIHFNLLDAAGSSLLYDSARPANLSELGARFAAGILRHAQALTALTAPSPVSATRLQPHHWSAGALCLADRNREALLRIPPLVPLGDGDPSRQLRLEYRAADAAANPYLALAALLRAGLEGVREELDDPPILDRDPSELGEDDQRRFGVGALPGSLGDALAALERDDTARGWMPPLLYDAYMSVKRAELEATAELQLEETCRLYADAY